MPLTDDELLALAGKQALARGRAYHADGRVVLSAFDSDGFAGEVEGQLTYTLRMRRSGGEWRWRCDCPAAADGSFCKHLVAAALTSRGELETDDGEAAMTAEEPRAPPRTSLAEWLQAQDSTRLAGWLMAMAEDDRHVKARLELLRASEDPSAVKKAIGPLLSTGGFLDYRRTNAFAARLDQVIATLRDTLARDASAARTLCEYAAGRLFKAYRNCDDSAGGVGERLQEIADLHVDACNAAMPGLALVKPLIALQLQDDWDLFPFAEYRDALGEAGCRAYGARMLADFEALPAPDEKSRWGPGADVERRLEAYARASDDLPLLLRVLDRHQGARDRQRYIDALREAGRDREALAHAERAVRRFPKDTALRHTLANCYLAAGLGDEAVEQAWLAFCEHPAESHWDLLKQIAAADWPRWRQQAIHRLAAAERGEATARVAMLMHDGDFAAAAAVADDNPVRIDTLARLARRIESDARERAGRFHLRVAEHLARDAQPARYSQIADALSRASKCLPAAQWRPLAQRIREHHARKRKLIGLLDGVGV